MIELVVSLLLISIVFVIAFVIGRKRYNAKRHEQAAINRAVVWYQQIMRMPIDEQAEELRKWRDYTKNLPITKHTLSQID